MRLPFSLVLGFLTFTFANSITFPSGEELEEVRLPSADFADIKDTGSYLFNTQNAVDQRLTLYFFAEDFASKRSPYFRAHPLFMACLQKIKRVLEGDEDEGSEVVLLSGFKVREEGHGTVEDDYSRSGTGAELAFGGGDATNVEEIAKAAVQECSGIFQKHQRDIGVTLYPNKVHVHLRGRSQSESEPYFSTSNVRMSPQQLKTKAQEWLNEALEVKISPFCHSESLERGKTYPEDATMPEDAVGELDEAITKGTPEDLKTLWQYAGTNIEFGSCNNGITSNHINSRCNLRLMTSRMHQVLRVLDKLVHDNFLGEKLVVKEAYKEQSTNPKDLHLEGRSLDVKLKNHPENLPILAQFAICAGSDYVTNKGNYIFMAVKKQKGAHSNWITFPEGALLDVEPPNSKKSEYELPANFGDSLPLFDSSHQEDLALSDYATVATFASKKSRYFRIDPLIVMCHAQLVRDEQEHPSQDQKTVFVIQSFMSQTELSEFGANDPRREILQTGRGIKVSYNSNNKVMSEDEIFTLANAIIDQCGPIFTSNYYELHMGLYRKGIFIGIGNYLEIWFEKKLTFPEHTTPETMEEKLTHRYKMAKDGHIIDPDDEETACLFSDPPQKQSLDFVHQHSEAVQRVRREVPSEEECIPSSVTEFCKLSENARKKAVEEFLTELNRKHLYHKETIKSVKGCLEVCGTCHSGNLYHDKVEHCNNLIHWIPFALYNEEKKDQTNFYSRENLDLRYHACSEHCLDKTPLFALIGPTLEGIFRPDPAKSVEERLYPSSGNPSPLLDLMLKMYASHAVGQVKFWVYDEYELISLRETLKAIMVYNKEVTGVTIYVEDENTIDQVDAALANMILEWTKSSCPKHSRDFIPEYSVEGMPKHIHKRSIDNFGDTLLENQFNYDKEWLDKISYI